MPAARAQVDRLHAAADERGIDMGAQVAGLRPSPWARAIRTRPWTGCAGPPSWPAGCSGSGPGRAALSEGRLLTARGRRREGVAELSRAAALLAGAEPFLRRIEADLAAAGMHAPRQEPGRRGSHRLLELTDRERDVVALVRRGLTNREAAAELYVSDKAVEYHLGNVYAKLGIRSRRELRARLGIRTRDRP